jgi:glucose-fructose oxidoreductase
VLLEKPMAISLAQCEAMVAVCDRAGVTFMVAHNERYKANFRAIGRAVREGRIGDLLTVRADMHGNAPTPDLAGRWVLDGRRAGGGILMSLAIHRLDLVRSVAGDVADVTARCRTTSPLYVNGAEDTASVQVRFAGGAVLSLTAAATRHAPPGSSTMHFVGTRGTIAALLPRTGYDAPPSICGEATGGEWRELDLAPDVAALESDKMYQAELLHFETCVRTRSEPHTSGRENFATMRLVFALYESARRGGEVVRL